MKFSDVKDPFVGLNKAGVYEATISEFVAQASKTGKLMLVPTVSVVSPSEYIGAEKSEYIVIGTDDDQRRSLKADLLGVNDATWQAKAGALKELATACGWPEDKELVFVADGQFPRIPKAFMEYCKGKKVWISVKQEREPLQNRDGSPNQYAGRVNGRINKFFKPGTTGLKVGISDVQLESIDYTASGNKASAPDTQNYPAAPPAE